MVGNAVAALFKPYENIFCISLKKQQHFIKLTAFDPEKEVFSCPTSSTCTLLSD